MNYESMSDFEINKAVSENSGYLVQDINDDSMIGMNSKFHAQYPNTVWVAELDCTTGEQCSAWEQKSFTRIADDAWPIIIENKISIEYDKSHNMWIAHQGDYLMGKFIEDCGYRNQCEDKNPLRAAMVVFLMMQETKQ